MTILEPQSGAIPKPTPGPLTQPYWDGCARGELRFQRCGNCGLATHTPAYLCSHCTSQDLSWEVSAGKGAIYSWTTVWRPQIPAFVTPYAAIIVDMDEGWQVLSNLIGCPIDDVEIGMRVEVEFHEIEGGFTLPYFRPAPTP
jgi:uncharacterized OB-fold protein